MATHVGTLVGRYEIDAELGRGAMGVVYRARDPRIDRTVAIKTVSLLDREPDAEREYRERFVVEARAAGRLSHPRIVTIFDVAEDPYTLTPYIVMEYVSGRSLEEMLCTENGTLPFDTALQLTQELAEALDYAHAQGIVHRDVKPSNIIVAEDGHPKIADFGIAKLLNALDLARLGTNRTYRPGNASLHVARTVEGRSCGRTFRPVFVGGDPVPVAHGTSAVPGQHCPYHFVQGSQPGSASCHSIQLRTPS